VWDGRHVKAQEVKTGPTNNILIAIEEGLEEGDMVCLRKPDNF
jgi:hypothetical protein